MGRFWAHVDGSETWTVHSAEGHVLGSVRLPSHVEVYQVGEKFVVGRVVLDDDTEEIRVFGVATPPAPIRPACMTRSDSFPAVESPRALELKGVLRTSMTAMEMFYSNYASYPTTVDSMPAFKAKLPAGIVFRVLSGDRYGYAVIAFDQRSSLACAFRAARSRWMIGWPDMTVRCAT